jgi:uncharacterized protein (UPF0548 family)
MPSPSIQDRRRCDTPSPVIKVGADVAILMRHFGFYSLNACRIVYVVDEDGRVKRFGFAHGTLMKHAERGEERFMVEWNRDEDQVWYDILAFSRSREMLARLGYPLSRSLQRKSGWTGIFLAQGRAAHRP